MGSGMTGLDFRALGEPDISVGGLSLWMRAREFPEATDHWDANWLNTVAHCQYPGARVSVDGPFVRTTELHEFAAACSRLHETLAGEAALQTLEPYLKVSLRGNGRGQIEVAISITSDHLNQQHSFLGEIDQTDLPSIVAGCRRVLERFPIVD